MAEHFEPAIAPATGGSAATKQNPPPSTLVRVIDTRDLCTCEEERSGSRSASAAARGSSSRSSDSAEFDAGPSTAPVRCADRRVAELVIAPILFTGAMLR
jgi:hypothetical protein